MDINGAKALKERLSLNGGGEPAPDPVDLEIPEDAPPVYHWTGVPRPIPESPADEAPTPNTSLISRLGLSFR